MSHRKQNESKVEKTSQKQLVVSTPRLSEAEKKARTQANKEKHLLKAAALKEKKAARQQELVRLRDVRRAHEQALRENLLREAAAHGAKFVSLPTIESLLAVERWRKEQEKRFASKH
jgi:hypothetical protein